MFSSPMHSFPLSSPWIFLFFSYSLLPPFLPSLDLYLHFLFTPTPFSLLLRSFSSSLIHAFPFSSFFGPFSPFLIHSFPIFSPSWICLFFSYSPFPISSPPWICLSLSPSHHALISSIAHSIRVFLHFLFLFFVPSLILISPPLLIFLILSFSFSLFSLPSFSYTFRLTHLSSFFFFILCSCYLSLFLSFPSFLLSYAPLLYLFPLYSLYGIRL